MTKCLTKDVDDDGKLFYCELRPDHDGRHHREVKIGYPRAYVVVDGRRETFHGMRSR